VSILIVTGTSTEVGKTVVTAAVATLALDRGSSVAVVKPAQTGLAPGEPGDLADVVRLAGQVTCAEPARYPDPLSPEAAARRSGLPAPDLAAVVAEVNRLAEEHRLVLVEGAGGLLVRYDADGTTFADLARELGAPLLVVTAAGLGTLNHTALTLEAMAHRGLPLAGLVLGSWPREPDLAARCNVADLERIAGRPLEGAVPAGAGRLDRPEFLAAARGALAPSLGGRFDAADFRRAALPAPAVDREGAR
jgi:dethiobiotin synthetase